MRKIVSACSELSKKSELEDTTTVAWWLDIMVSLSAFLRICEERMEEAVIVCPGHFTDYIGFLGQVSSPIRFSFTGRSSTNIQLYPSENRTNSVSGWS
jgi:hypothetical protein